MNFTVRFRQTESGYWRGNGFGNAGASWEAVVSHRAESGDRKVEFVIAEFNGDGRFGTTLRTTYNVELPSSPFQSRQMWNRELWIPVTRWKKLIRQQVEAFNA